MRDGSYKQARVALDMALDALEQVNITSPIDGVVGYVNAQVGATASMAQPLVSVVDLSQMVASFGLSEQQINQVEVGKTIEIYFDSIQEEPFVGTIIEASPQADVMSKSFPVKVAVANPDETIKSGMSCTISLIQEQVDGVLLVSEDAIRYTAEQAVVFVLDGEQVRQVVVETLLSDGSDTAIRGDLSAGEKIVVLGKERLSDGALVRVVEEGAE